MRNTAQAFAPGFAAAATWLCLAAGCAAEPSDAGQLSGGMRDISDAAMQSVLVRGWIRRGEVGLDPVLGTDAPGGPPDIDDGPFSLRGFRDDGTVAFDISFGDAQLAAVSSAAEQHFAFVIPAGAGGALALSRIEFDAGEGRRVAREARVSAAALREALQRDVTVQRGAAGGVRLRWNHTDYPLIQVRDPATGAVLATARRGDITLELAHTELELTLSEGVRSTAALIRVQ